VSIAPPTGIFFDPLTVSGRSDLAWLPDGRHLLVLYAKAYSDREQIGMVGLSGGFSTLTNDVNAYSQLAVSGNGKTLATVLTNVDSSLAYYQGDGGPMLSRTPLRITPSRLAWADEDHLYLITRDTGISKLDRATGSLQPIDTGNLDIGFYINTCPDGQVLFTASPKGASGEYRLFHMNGDGSGVTQLTTSGIARAPFCTPDSQKVYFTIRDKVGMSSLSLWSVPMSGGTPQKELAVQGQGSVMLSRETKLAEVFSPLDLVWYTVIRDLATRQIVHRLPLDVNYHIRNSYPSFSPDGKALVGGVTYQGGNALRYQPIDGSPTHLLTEPTPETLTSFAWSPSGSKLGVLHLRKSSDVVLITDLTGQQSH
jgi:hypothetical protein